MLLCLGFGLARQIVDALLMLMLCFYWRCLSFCLGGVRVVFPLVCVSAGVGSLLVLCFYWYCVLCVLPFFW